MDNKKRNILLGVLILGVISMTVAFAALSTTLSINGTASLPATSWNIHFANGVDNTPNTHANGKVNKGTITGLQFAATSISNFTATLYQPNDEVVYNFNIVNEGTIAGQLDNFTKTITCNSASCDMITYTITCEDAQHNDANQSDYILASGASVSCEMKIKYNDQTNSNNGTYTQGAVSATATASWLYKQVSGGGDNSGGSGDSGNSGSGDSGNSGSGGSGGNEPSNPYETTFDGNYTYRAVGTNGYISSLNNNWQYYIRNDGTTKDICGVFPSGTVCLTPDTNGRSSDFGSGSVSESNISGYAAAKVEEMKAKGATTCTANALDNGINCYFGDFYCGVNKNGSVLCDDGNHGCGINGNIQNEYCI